MRRLIAKVTARSAVFAVLLLIAAVATLAWWDRTAAAAAARDRQIEQVAAVLAVTTEEAALRATLSRVDPSGRLAVHLTDGRRVGASRVPVDDVAGVARLGEPRTVDTGDGRSMLRPVVAAGETVVVELFVPDGAAGQVLGATAAITGGFAVLGALAVALAVTTADRLLAPTVHQLRVLADAAGAARHSRRDELTDPADDHVVPSPPSTDVPELAAIATMIERVRELASSLIAKEHKLIADVSHRLRTPLTALRLDADAIGQGHVADRIRSAVVTLEHDVDDIIRTAGRQPEAVDTVGSTCDMAEVVRRRMEFWSLLATNQDRTCAVDCPDEPVPVALAVDDVAAIVDALVGNVFRHTTPGVPLAVTVGRHYGWALLVVDDGGPGIGDPEGALRRGVSGDGSTGLGLDIARAGAEATGGTIHVELGKLGGARIRLRFAEAGSLHDELPRAWRLWSGQAGR